MDDQMELFNEGELPTDPVSGNDIPPGATAKEVRDDVPVNMSEGEYVVPADVVRFFGVSYFEKLREKAKKGMAELDQGGRIGGEPVNNDELSPEEMEELQGVMGMAEGGLVQQGTYTPEYFQKQVPEIDPMAYSYPGAVADAYKGTNPYLTGARPQAAPSVAGYAQYIGPQNQIMMIPVDANGNPTIAVPEGFVLFEGQQVETPEAAKPTRKVGSAQAAPAEEKEMDYTWLENFHADPLVEAERLLGTDSAWGFGGTGGLLGNAAQLNDIARIRGYARAVEATNPDLAAKLNGMVDESVKNSSLGIQALDDVIASGRMYERQVTNWMGQTGAQPTAAPAPARTGGGGAPTPTAPTSSPVPRLRPPSEVDKLRADRKTEDYKASSRAKNRVRDFKQDHEYTKGSISSEGARQQRKAEEDFKPSVAETALKREGGVEGRLAKRTEQDAEKKLDPRNMNKGGLVSKPKPKTKRKKKGGLGSK